MPRAVTLAFNAAVSAGTVKLVLLFEAWFDTGALLFWTGYGSLTWSGKTYTGSGNLIALSPIKETNAVESAGMTFTLSGISSAIISLAMSEKYQGRTVRVYLAPMVDGVGLVADPHAMFTGRADTMSITDAGDTCTIELSAENHLVDLLRGRSRQYTHQDQQIDYSGDVFFNFVEQIQDKPIKWGAP